MLMFGLQVILIIIRAHFFLFLSLFPRNHDYSNHTVFYTEYYLLIGSAACFFILLSLLKEKSNEITFLSLSVSPHKLLNQLIDIFMKFSREVILLKVVLIS